MEKQTIKHIWSYFQNLSHEEQRLFCYDKKEWKSYKISHKETANSGRLDLKQIQAISKELIGKEVYIVHNHPTQTPSPSNPDHFQYRYIESILLLYGITIKDYLIVSKYGYYSFEEAGYLRKKPAISSLSYGKETPIAIPNVSFQDEVNKQASHIKQLSQTYKEMIFHPKMQYGNQESFSPDFFLEKEKQLVYQNIFFQVRDTQNPNQLNRLQYINKIIDPIEIYWIEKDSIRPLKLEGIL